MQRLLEKSLENRPHCDQKISLRRCGPAAGVALMTEIAVGEAEVLTDAADTH